MEQPLFRRIAKMLVGADLGTEATATAIVTIGFAHPLLFTLTWIFLLTTCTRVVVSEIERGTADLLLALPVSRETVYASFTVVWVAAGIPISLAPLCGAWLGESVAPLWEPLDLSRLAILIVNLLALYLVVGSATVFVSTLVTRRGSAIAIVLAWLLGSFLLNFLALSWSTAKAIAFIGVLHYYRPLPVIRSGEWPIGNITVLVAAAVGFWLAGRWQFARRDIPAA